MKTTAEIKEALGKVYEGRLENIDGYDYIPWPDAQRAADQAFDPDGYSVQVLKTWMESVPNPEGNLSHGYAALVRVEVQTADGTHFYRDGLGFSEVVFTKAGRALIDSAIKGCVSRALVRALTLFGDAFGLKLYDKEDTQAKTGAVPSNGNGGYNKQSNGSSGDKRPSDPQRNILTTKLGFRSEQVDAMPFSLWKPILDSYFTDKLQPPAIRTKYASQLAAIGIGAPKGDGLPV